jgi:putative phosphoesterase
LHGGVDPFDAYKDSPTARKEPRIERVPARSAAFLSDIHANDAALTAVLAELAADPPDVVVLNGDITWGTFPTETVDLILELRDLVRRVVLIRGNGDRALLELHSGDREPSGPRDPWMIARHSPRDVDVLSGVVFQVEVDIADVGVVRACHGSPRADIELITPGTPLDRLAAATADVDADVLLTGHVHVQFHRPVDGLRIRHSMNPGSVGIPYAVDRPGAYWLRIDGTRPDPFEFRRTDYDLDGYMDRMLATDDPRADVIADYLRKPPTRDEMVAHAEQLVFSD